MPRVHYIVLLCTIVLLYSTEASAEVTLSGNITNLSLSGQTDPKIEFRLLRFGANIPRVIGSNTIATEVISCTLTSTDCTVSSTGVLSGTIVGNNQINPAGTIYRACVFDQGRRFRCADFTINEPTFDLDSATPLTTFPVSPVTPTALTQVHVHNEDPAATSWTINHNFATKDVVCDFFNSSDQEIYPDLVTHTDSNNVTATFVIAQAGKAVCIRAQNATIGSGLSNVIITNPTANQSIAGGFSLTVDGNFLLATAGQDLCSASVRCDAFLRTLDVSTTSTLTGNVTFGGTIIPSATGQDIGSASARPDAFLDVARTGVLNDVRVVGDKFTTIQAALTDLPSSGGMVFIPCGTYDSATARTITQEGVVVQGAGEDCVLIRTTSATGNVFEIDADTAVVFKDLRISTTIATPTAGCGVEVDGAGAGTSNAGSKFVNVRIDGVFDGICFVDASRWHIDRSYIVSVENYGVRVRNTQSPDTGDSVISNTTFDESTGAVAAVRYESGGGLKVINSKFLNYDFSIDLNVDTAASTSILLVSNNSFEGFDTSAIRLDRTGAGSFVRFVIDGNQFAQGVAGLTFVDVKTTLEDGMFSNNIMAGESTSTAFTTAANDWTITGNFFNVFSVGVGGTSGLRTNSQGNTFLTVTTPHSCAACTNWTIQEIQTGLTHANLPGSAKNGSTVYCTDCTSAAPCAASGSGNIAHRENGAWNCD